jgi:type II secretory pathway pseudopilin PulG
MTDKKNGLSGFAKAMIAASVAGALCIPCTGILAAVAIPGFITYVRRSKTAEARANISAIRVGITEYATRESVTATGDLRGPVLIESLPATPSVESVGAMKQTWPLDANPGWSAIGFEPFDPLYYSYSVTTDALANTVVIEAVGDLNDNGIRSSFAQHGHMEPSGDITWGEVIVTNELE